MLPLKILMVVVISFKISIFALVNTTDSLPIETKEKL